MKLTINDMKNQPAVTAVTVLIASVVSDSCAVNSVSKGEVSYSSTLM